ncbi:MAG: undecaprenyldiphospho-muramoylpentapeptide beta-N-acetylglucosaminyltransferase [Halieaceae bacterium]|jgi:UDP-N-acetylglucosamine--N-acetylmuramyl-(pentapeptide) pyrophosphoryl-undecaprenol N-acetylglucosamine transferase|nr:undecaprenyldiphospho-muramoylpentapeptide beta-N-acetylglucosaminyltransferase [Halieaceae bacterium]
MKPGRVLIMAGGTGGHVYPALAVADCLAQRGWQVDWVGTDRGIESRVVPAAGFLLHKLAVLGIRGKGLVSRFKGLLYLLWSGVQALRLVRRVRPDVVLGMGGYAAGPAGLAAALLRIPLVIHEQNAVAGTTNRLLAPLARRVLSGLPGAFNGKRVVQVVGNPVRAEIAAVHFERGDLHDCFDATRPLRLLVLGGSLGAAPINDLLPQAVVVLVEAGEGARLEVRHQCGERHAEAAQSAWSHVVDARVEVLPFIEDMAAAYAWADLVVCRAGALTVSELAVTGTPAILVPLPHAIDDHQTRNAEILSRAGAGILLPQATMTPASLAQHIQDLLDKPADLQRMSRAARIVARVTATETVADVIEEVANGA